MLQVSIQQPVNNNLYVKQERDEISYINDGLRRHYC